MFKNTLRKSVEIGAFRFLFYVNEKKINKGSVSGTYLKIVSLNSEVEWSITIPGNAHVFGYLLESLNQEKSEQLHGYATICYTTSVLLTTDEGFNDDIQRAILKWQKRQDKLAENAAKGVLDRQEKIDQVFMTDIAVEAALDEATRKEKRKQAKEVVREAIVEIIGQNQNEEQ